MIINILVNNLIPLEYNVENIVQIDQSMTSSWLSKHCRKVVFTILNKLDEGTVELHEAGKTHHFGRSSNPAKEPLHGHIQIHDSKVYVDIIKGGTIGAAEAFIDGRWSSENLTELIRIFARAQKHTDKLENKKAWLSKLKTTLFHRRNRNSERGSKKNILAHYDLGNELYTRFLDPNMMYSSAIYPASDSTLEQAQLHKLDTICKRLQLTHNDHLLEIGTGWGGLAIFAAQNYGCKVTTTTISDEQHLYAEQKINALGLNDQITLLKEDYRNLTGEYDKLVSIEMIEAVGYEYMQSFFTQCNNRLKPGGKLLIQAITIADQRFQSYLNNVDFIQRYIFPGGFLPSITLISEHLRDNTDMVIEEVHDIGLDYAKTLAHWREAFLLNWTELKEHGYDERFKRLWLYYLGYCEGAFIERSTSSIQLVARK